MQKGNQTGLSEKLVDALLSLRTKEECEAFLEDLCTIQEIKSLEQRIQVAALLREKVTYAHISETTGASTATISRVNRSLLYGAGGYQAVLSRMTTKEEQP